ncbi:sulfurtransferase TusA family protein [Methanoregula sp.]|uniref:sulfurtransferase TusA family protein n=1 Tax=Methanoregula sp. TaxID=2052170 RepID=UPI0025F7CEA4|nr:sulfurtransferase TusA family protein [Methanoregula sp.]
MATKNLDITGKVCPYCLLAVQKAASELSSGDELIVTCDHPPAATSTIPQYAEDNNLNCDAKKTAPGLWEIRLSK